MARVLLPGKPFPLGAIWDGHGVNFALYSEHGTKVDLCLFESTAPDSPCETLRLREVTGHVWHVYIPGIQPGQLYGYRVHGPCAPETGDRFNSAKLLIDPYALALAGTVNWDAPVFGYPLGHKDNDLAIDDRDDAWGMP
ncbi:MAG: glycogen debranching protein GlgX, partial [Ktedonobacterales bacterium]